MCGQRGRRRGRRAAEAGLQAAGHADGLLLDGHPAHLQPLVRPRQLPLGGGASAGPGSQPGGRLRPVGERGLDGAAEAEARQARRPEHQLPGAQDPGRTQHLGRADAERLPGCAVQRGAMSHARRERGHRPVDHRMRPLHQLIPLVGALALLVAGAARAEPYLMVREGAKCSACHTNQTGGGKRTAFAHIHAHDIEHDLDLLPVPAGVKPFNGELNSYASIGGDLRVQNITVFQDRPDRLGRVPTNEAFRRSVRSNDSRLFEFLVYGQVDLLPDFVTLYADEDFTSGANNREAFGMIRGFLPWDTYVKAGRLFPAYGLRVQDDQAFIRARTGYTFQTPDEGGEIGIQPGPFFLASSITNGTAGDKDVAATLNGYIMLEDVPVVRHVLAGASFARQSNKRYEGGFYGGSNWWRFTYLGELDWINDRKLGSPGRNDKYAAYGEADFLLFDWLNLRGVFEFLKVTHDRDLTRYAIGAEPFVNRVIQPRIQYRINNGIA